MISDVPLQIPGQHNKLVVPDVGSCTSLSMATVNECEMQELSIIDVMPPMGECVYTCTNIHPLYTMQAGQTRALLLLYSQHYGYNPYNS